MFTHSHILSRVVEIIVESIQTSLEGEVITKDTNIAELHIDSLSMVEIITKLEEEFQVDLAEDVAVSFKDATIFAVATAIIDELVAEGVQVEDDKDKTPQDGPVVFEQMVAGLVKTGEAIVAEMSPSKSICLAVALTAALRVSRQMDRTKKYVVYGKENVDDDAVHPAVSARIGDYLTPTLAHKLHMAIGMFGEAGEILEAVVAEIETGKRDIPNEIEESGDIEFYHEGYRQVCGFSREDAITANIEKLGKRYQGHKYTDAQAIARADKTPEAVVANLNEAGVNAFVVEDFGSKSVAVVQPLAMMKGYGKIVDRGSDAHASPRAQ